MDRLRRVALLVIAIITVNMYYSVKNNVNSLVSKQLDLWESAENKFGII